MLNKVFMGITLSLIIGICTTSFLWNQSQKENASLSERVLFLETQIAQAQDIMKKEKELRQSTESIYSTLIQNYNTLDSEYDDLKYSLEQRRVANAKCPKPITNPRNTENSANSEVLSDGVADDIAAVGRLLNKAACTANGNCPSSH